MRRRFSFRRFRCERLNGGLGNDTSNGGRGRDFMSGGQGDGDELTGGEGRDRFRVRDGEVDKVHCSRRVDRVLADQFDQVDGDCERVERRDITSLDQVQDQEENSTENPPEDDDEG